MDYIKFVSCPCSSVHQALEETPITRTHTYGLSWHVGWFDMNTQEIQFGVENAFSSVSNLDFLWASSFEIKLLL